MELHYLLSFAFLTLEVIFFFVLIAPLPFAARRKLFRFLASPPARRAQYWMKIGLVFIAVLWMDSVSKLAEALRRLRAEVGSSGEGGLGQTALVAAVEDGGRNSKNALASRYYTERNFYLTGFTLLLGLYVSHVAQRLSIGRKPTPTVLTSSGYGCHQDPLTCLPPNHGTDRHARRALGARIKTNKSPGPGG